MEQVVRAREQATTLHEYWITTIIFNAIFERDIDAIEQIISRVDGATPDSDTRHLYANYFGDALDDVLDLQSTEQAKLHRDDPVIIGLAKCTIGLSLIPGIDVNAQKVKNKAMRLIFERAGGRKPAPVSRTEVVEFQDPLWMRGLPEGESHDEQESTGVSDIPGEDTAESQTTGTEERNDIHTEDHEES